MEPLWHKWWKTVRNINLVSYFLSIFHTKIQSCIKSKPLNIFKKFFHFLIQKGQRNIFHWLLCIGSRFGNNLTMPLNAVVWETLHNTFIVSCSSVNIIILIIPLSVCLSVFSRNPQTPIIGLSSFFGDLLIYFPDLWSKVKVTRGHWNYLLLYFNVIKRPII